MDVYETDLPGVGKRFELELRDDCSVVIVIHNNGQREVFKRRNPDADGEELFKLTDSEARVVGSILEGAYFQPVSTDTTETIIGEDTIIEWFTLQEDSPFVGETIRESNIRQRTGVTVIAVQRDDDVTPSPDPDFGLRAGDVLITVGSQDNQTDLEELLGVAPE